MRVSTKDYWTPKTPCPHCGFVMDLATGVEHDDPPSAGSVGICESCAEVHVFTEELARRRPTADEQIEIDADAKVQQCRRAIKRSKS